MSKAQSLPLAFRVWVVVLIALVIGSWTYFVFGGAAAAVQAQQQVVVDRDGPALPEPLLVPGEGNQPGRVLCQPSQLPAPKAWTWTSTATR